MQIIRGEAPNFASGDGSGSGSGYGSGDGSGYGSGSGLQISIGPLERATPRRARR